MKREVEEINKRKDKGIAPKTHMPPKEESSSKEESLDDKEMALLS